MAAVPAVPDATPAIVVAVEFHVIVSAVLLVVDDVEDVVVDAEPI